MSSGRSLSLNELSASLLKLSQEMRDLQVIHPRSSFIQLLGLADELGVIQPNVSLFLASKYLQLMRESENMPSSITDDNDLQPIIGQDNVRSVEDIENAQPSSTTTSSSTSFLESKSINITLFNTATRLSQNIVANTVGIRLFDVTRDAALPEVKQTQCYRIPPNSDQETEKNLRELEEEMENMKITYTIK